MLGVLIFYVHILGVVTLFTRNWQRGGFSEGMLGAAFFALIFSVGWTFASFVMSFLIAPQGFGTWCDRNTLALVLLTVLEFVLYRLFFWDYIFRGDSQSAK